MAPKNEKKAAPKAVEAKAKVEVAKPEVTPAPVVETVVPVEAPKALGTLGGKQIVSVTPNKKFIGGKSYHEYITADQAVYLLNDHDVLEQVK